MPGYLLLLHRLETSMPAYLLLLHSLETSTPNPLLLLHRLLLVTFFSLSTHGWRPLCPTIFFFFRGSRHLRPTPSFFYTGWRPVYLLLLHRLGTSTPTSLFYTDPEDFYSQFSSPSPHWLETSTPRFSHFPKLLYSSIYDNIWYVCSYLHNRKQWRVSSFSVIFKSLNFFTTFYRSRCYDLY